MFRKIFLISIVAIGILLPLSVRAQTGTLSDNQELWLEKRNRVLIIRPERSHAPYSYINSGTQTPQGIAVDYMNLVAKKIGATLEYTEPKTRLAILNDIQDGKEGIILGIARTEDKEKYLYFTDPYITLPGVIIVRKDYPNQKRFSSLAAFEGKRIAVGSGYAMEDYITSNYQKIILDPVTDNEVAIQKVLLGEVDAAVLDIASLSYYTKNNALSYVTIVGQTGFEYEFTFGIPRTMPELQLILNAGLMQITDAEKDVILRKWVTFNTEEKPTTKNTPQSMIIILIMTVLGFIVVVVMVLHYVRHHYKEHRRLFAIKTLGDSPVEDLKKQLQELEKTSKDLSENLEEIKELEEKIEEKIETLQ